MIWRMTKWLGVLSLALFALIFIVLPLVANTEKGRDEVARILSRALNRDVTIGELDVGLFYASVDVGTLAIANPDGYPEGDLLSAGRLDLDTSFGELLDGRVVGAVTGSGLEVHIMRKGGGTNLDGLAGDGGDEEGGGETPDLDLELELTDSRLIVEDLDKGERLELEGVSLFMRLTNHAGEAQSGLKIRVASIDQGALNLRDLEIDAALNGGWLDLERLTANLPGKGALSGTGRMRVQGGDEWNVKLDAKEVGLEEDLVPIVAGLYPFASAAGGQIDGQLNARFAVSGRGLTWELMKPTLAGTGSVSLNGLSLPTDSLLGMLAGDAGRAGGTMALNNAGAEFQLAQGWVKFNRLSASGKELRYDLAGRVSLDGELDLAMDLMPLVKAFGGGKTYGKIKQYTDELPIKIRGTTVAPAYELPVADIAENAVKKTLEKELGKLFK